MRFDFVKNAQSTNYGKCVTLTHIFWTLAHCRYSDTIYRIIHYSIDNVGAPENKEIQRDNKKICL